MPGAFLSYRWRDCPNQQGFVDDLYRYLRRRVGRRRIFRDRYSIREGDNLEKTIPAAASDCDVMFVVMGEAWLRLLDERKDDPDDLLRIEIATAIQRGIPVIPLFYELRRHPRKSQLPRDIQELSMRLGFDVEKGTSTYRRVSELAMQHIHDGQRVLGRVRRILSDFILRRSDVVPSKEFGFLARKPIAAYPVQFRVWVSYRRVFSISKLTVKRWLDDSDDQPVILLFVNRRRSHAVEYGFELLSDWLRAHPDSLVKKNRTIEFHLDKKVLTPKQRQLAAAALQREYEAVSGHRESTAPNWWARSESPRLPLGQPELFGAVGRFNRLEVPLEVLLETSSLGPMSERDQFHMLRDFVRSSLAPRAEENQKWVEKLTPHTRSWVQRMLCSPAEVELAEQTRQLGLFFENVNTVAREKGGKLNFPKFKWQQVNAWRIAFQMFPVAGFEMVSRFYALGPSLWSREPERLAGTLLLISPLTIVGDGLIAGRAHDLLRKFGNHFDSSAPKNATDYYARANYFAVRAEADAFALAAYRNFTEKREREELELSIMRHYYEQGDSHSAAVVKAKLDHPTPRLVNTLSHEEWRAEILRKRKAIA